MSENSINVTDLTEEAKTRILAELGSTEDEGVVVRRGQRVRHETDEEVLLREMQNVAPEVMAETTVTSRLEKVFSAIEKLRADKTRYVRLSHAMRLAVTGAYHAIGEILGKEIEGNQASFQKFLGVSFKSSEGVVGRKS